MFFLGKCEKVISDISKPVKTGKENLKTLKTSKNRSYILSSVILNQGL